MVRCFIAIYPIRSKKVHELQDKIAKFINGKSVEKENMHITLSFLGEKKESEINEIKNKIDKVAKNSYKREAILTKIKFIPNENFIRVIAVDVVGLDDLSKSIEKEVGGDVKPPHLTLFRVKNVKDKKTLLEFRKIDINERIFIDKISIMKSTLTPKGPVYEVIHSFELASNQ
jgi:2'-5' RNA ligase